VGGGAVLAGALVPGAVVPGAVVLGGAVGDGGTTDAAGAVDGALVVPGIAVAVAAGAAVVEETTPLVAPVPVAAAFDELLNASDVVVGLGEAASVAPPHAEASAMAATIAPAKIFGFRCISTLHDDGRPLSV
jgi:hypothetical protein